MDNPSRAGRKDVLVRVVCMRELLYPKKLHPIFLHYFSLFPESLLLVACYDAPATNARHFRFPIEIGGVNGWAEVIGAPKAVRTTGSQGT